MQHDPIWISNINKCVYTHTHMYTCIYVYTHTYYYHFVDLAHELSATHCLRLHNLPILQK